MTLTILLAEDHDANRAVLRRRLERRGYAVVEAADGAQAVERFCAAPPDIVIMDLSMPNMNGIEAFEQIRASKLGTNVPVVALTAHAMDAMRETCESRGFSDFLTKPIDFERLVSSVRMLTAGVR